jgi:regulatory protein
MLMRINQIKQHGKQVSVTLEHEVLMLEPDLVYQYHLHQDMDLDESLLSLIRAENQSLYYFRLAVSMLKKPLTAHELNNYLVSKGATSSVADEVLSRVKARRYIDDDAYILQYVEQKKHQSGPEKLREEMLSKGLDADMIQKVIAQIPEKQILKVLIPAKISSIKNKSKKAMMSSVRMYFISKGFSQELVESIVLHALSSYQADEQKLLEQAYHQTLKKYEHKFSGYELNQRLIQKLYQKGFKMDDIKNIIQKHLDA